MPPDKRNAIRLRLRSFRPTISTPTSVRLYFHLALRHDRMEVSTWVFVDEDRRHLPVSSFCAAPFGLQERGRINSEVIVQIAGSRLLHNTEADCSGAKLLP
ncbi:hypothetical protein JAAARDRAFT_470375 [Jaapia argillacea MUCL 33604]|uniref:Uncharacterized protein n=1 Tax=Jaapia argillacea MUCL 33604 TaxID=933084 RepID=A0A067Q6S4_9AGAM|nr:hypothetical protein JAAARDRAFT_470375 [Jaapia argillacea MUCL 33604]